MGRSKVQKDAGPLPGQQPLFLKERLNDMPLAKGRVAKAALAFGASGDAQLQLRNLEEVLVWKLAFTRLTKADPVTLAQTFHPEGSRHMRAFKDVPAAPMMGGAGGARPQLDGPMNAGLSPALTGNAEFGLQTDDVKEYFLSKFGDLVGVILVKRTASGWSAGLSKSNVPRVLSKDAVSEGLMPPSGHSALPKSLEAVVPAEYQYWKATGDDARLMRDAFVESGFFNDDCIKAVDGELRKVEVKYFLYEQPEIDVTMSAAKRTFGESLTKALPEAFISKSFTPMRDEDWLESLDKHDAEGNLAILSPSDRSFNVREMVRAAKTLKGDFLLEHVDTRANRAAFATAGILFKVAGHPDHLLCASFQVHGVQKLDDGPVVKTLEFQGIKIDIDRPVGFVQTGKDETGAEWSRTYQNDYGFFPGTKGGDGDNIDVFIGPDESATSAFWVTQKKGDGSFDEYKVFVGFSTEMAALDCYKAHIPTRFFDSVTEVPIGAIKGLLGLEPQPMAKRLLTFTRKIDGVPYGQVRDAVNTALSDKFPPDQSSNACSPCGYWCDEVYDDHAIYSKDGKLWSIGFTYSDGQAQLTSEPTEVKRIVSYEPVSGGAAPAAAPPATGPAPTPEATKRWKSTTVRIALTKDDAADEHYVLGIVLEPDVVDAQNDTYSAAEVRAASEKFMEQHRNMGLMHKQKVNDKVQILENYIAPTDFNVGDQVVKAGTWMMGVRVRDEALWKAIKTGGLTGFSIGGSAIRKPVEEGV